MLVGCHIDCIFFILVLLLLPWLVALLPLPHAIADCIAAGRLLFEMFFCWYCHCTVTDTASLAVAVAVTITSGQSLKSLGDLLQWVL